VLTGPIMDRHPLIFLAIVIMIGVLNGTTLALVIRGQQSIDQLDRSFQNMLNSLAAILDEPDRIGPHDARASRAAPATPDLDL
jgi:hypothetical protein